MNIKIKYTDKATKKLVKLDRVGSENIVKKIRFYATQKNPLAYAKKLKPPFGGLFRFRIGEYRAIFDVDSNGNITILILLAVTHRKDVYRD